jgi:hypothetical protein
MIAIPMLCAMLSQPRSRAGGDSGAAPPGVTAQLGDLKVLLHDGQHSLRYFPDTALSILSSKPEWRVLMVAGRSTYLMTGKGMDSLAPAAEVLTPGGPGSYDNGYAGIGGAYADEKTGAVLALYHAEDQEDMRTLPGGIPGFYASIALAVSTDGGGSFAKQGPVITADQAKDPMGPPDQGAGEVALTPDATGEYLYAYYCDHSRPDNRGAQICLARGRIADGGRPGTWRKYYQGTFSQPGLGGRDTPVMSAQSIGADATFPHVVWLPEAGVYLMTFCINVYREFATGRPEKSGMYLAASRDGIHWGEPTLLFSAYVVTHPGYEVAWHPTLVLSGKQGDGFSGWLYYSYSERFGHVEPERPHYLVGRPIVVEVH